MSFRTHGNIMEHITVGADVYGNTTAATTSMAYDMTDYDKALFIVGLGSAATSAPGRPVIEVKQSSNATGALTTVSATVAMGGSTNASILTAVKAFTITLATDATNDNIVIVNGTTFTLTTSTVLLAVQTASAASANYFGSTIDATSAEGLEHASSALAVIMNNTTWGIGKIGAAVTISTVAVRVEVVDTASTYFTVQTTGGAAAIIPHVEKVEYAVEVHADDMTTGQKCLTCYISTHAEGFDGKSITCIRTGRRAGGIVDHHHGLYTKTT